MVTTGVRTIVRDLYDDGRLDGVLGMGGTGGTSVATAAMRDLPVGVPKIMVSTIGGGDVSAYAGTKDITFMPSVVDVAGLNRISRKVFSNAAGAVAGMVKTPTPAAIARERPLIAASMFGNTTSAVRRACEVLEEGGYESLIFHCTGIGGKTMESLISEKYVVGVVDITTTELADYVCGGIYSAGENRCMAAALSGIPSVLVPGCVDMANFAGIDTVPGQVSRAKFVRVESGRDTSTYKCRGKRVDRKNDRESRKRIYRSDVSIGATERSVDAR